MSRAKTILEQLDWCGTLRISKNPQKLRHLMRDLGLTREDADQESGTCRCLYDPVTKESFYWRARMAEHYTVAKDLGLDYDRCVKTNPYLLMLGDELHFMWGGDEVLTESLEMAGDIRVSVNPSNSKALLRDLKLKKTADGAGSDVRILALVVSDQLRDLYMWDGYYMIHAAMARELGINYMDCVEGSATLNDDGSWDLDLDDSNAKAYDAVSAQVEKVFQ